jgi:hypothetical protein
MDQTSQIRVGDVTEDTLWYVACCAQVEGGAEVNEAGMPGMRERFGIPRTIFINGVEEGWGYEIPAAGAFDGAERAWSHEAPKQWLREQIAAALRESQEGVRREA